MKALPPTAEIVIVGGGIIGASVAYYLARRGAGRVLLLEKGLMGEGATGKCAGGIRRQFSTEINVRFSLLSQEVFRGFREAFGVDPGFHPIGYLFLASNPAHWEVLGRNRRLLDRLGVDTLLLDRDAIGRRWPFLRVEDLQGGSYSEGDGYAGPYEVLQGFVRGARRLGAELREGVEVTGIRVRGGRVQAVETRGGERIETPLIVNAAGPYASRVARMAGLDLPVSPLRRQVFFTDAFEDLPPVFPMVIDLAHGWYMRREGRGLLLAGPQDAQSSFNEKVDFEAREWCAVRSVHRVPVLERARIMRGWAGLYEITPDCHGIIGAFPEVEGFVCACGFSGHGFQHSPAVGSVVAELATEGRAHTLDIHPLRPTRFREKDLIHEPLTAFRS